MAQSIVLIGAPADHGGLQPGCLMGPDALRTAGLETTLKELGFAVQDAGNLKADAATPECSHPNAAIHHLSHCDAWIRTLGTAAAAACGPGRVPVFLGGDHSISAGTVAGVARRAAEMGRELFVLWLDAHSDFHSLVSTRSGNLHGTPVAYFTGQPGFDGYFPALATAVRAENICMMGLRSVDAAEQEQLGRTAIDVIDMRIIDEIGVARPLRAFLERVRRVGGSLHVSFDVDFLAPEIAPAVGTTVPGGATFREAHLIMEILHDSALVTSLDIAELNPFLDERGRTAKLIVDLIASLFGKRVIDRATRSF